MSSRSPSSRSSPGAVIALDLGGTKLAAALFRNDGKPQAKEATPLEDRSGVAVGQLILTEVNRLRQAADEAGEIIAGVGVAVPGIANSQTGRVWAPNIDGWEDYPLQDEIRAAVANQTVTVVVASDRAACILGEAWQGVARGCRDAIFLAVGTGIGAGILSGGRVLEGAHGVAGAAGWMALDSDFRDDYKRWGCFESHASGDGLTRRYREMLSRYRRDASPQQLESLTTRDLFDAYQQCEPVSQEVLREAVRYWGRATANLVSLFNPEKIIFGGGVFGPATRFLHGIAVEARRWAQPVAMNKVTLEASRIGGDAALYGAAKLARSGGF